jgi:hypothetical protein
MVFKRWTMQDECAVGSRWVDGDVKEVSLSVVVTTEAAREPEVASFAVCARSSTPVGEYQPLPDRRRLAYVRILELSSHSFSASTCSIIFCTRGSEVKSNFGRSRDAGAAEGCERGGVF